MAGMIVRLTLFGDQQALEVLLQQLRIAQRSGRFRLIQESVSLRNSSETLVEVLAEVPRRSSEPAQ
jgi:hypothetical protein